MKAECKKLSTFENHSLTGVIANKDGLHLYGDSVSYSMP